MSGSDVSPHDHTWRTAVDTFQEAADSLGRDLAAHAGDAEVRSEMRILRAEVVDVLFRLKELGHRVPEAS